MFLVRACVSFCVLWAFAKGVRYWDIPGEVDVDFAHAMEFGYPWRPMNRQMKTCFFFYEVCIFSLSSEVLFHQEAGETPEILESWG